MHCKRTLICLLAMLVLVVGCASRPTQELSEARRAEQAARSAGAEMVFATRMQAVDELVDSAARALERGDHDVARERARAGKRMALELRAVTVALEAAASAAAGLPEGSDDRARAIADVRRARDMAAAGDVTGALDLLEKVAEGTR